MDSALEKLGVYEFFTVFLAGIISEALLCVTLDQCFYISLGLHEKTLLFVLLGYFIGLLLHELSVYLKRPFKELFCTTFTDRNRFFTGADLEMARRVKSYVLKKDETDTASDAYVVAIRKTSKKEAKHDAYPQKSTPALTTLIPELELYYGQRCKEHFESGELLYRRIEKNNRRRGHGTISMPAPLFPSHPRGFVV